MRGRVTVRPPGSTKRCIVVCGGMPMRMVSKRFVSWVRVTSTRANGSVAATAGSRRAAVTSSVVLPGVA